MSHDISGTDLLDHAEHVFINFKNGTYQWVDIQRFRLPEAPDDATEATGATNATDNTALLTALIDHDLFGDNHAGGDPGDDPERHGPYWRDRIKPACYEPTASGDAEQHLRHWAEQHAPLPQHLRADMDNAVYQPLRAAAVHVYRLRDLGWEAFHDWGSVFGEFHEYVLIDRPSAALTVIVAADD